MNQFDDSLTNTRIADLHAQEEERLVQATAPRLGFEYINLHGYTINPEALVIIPEEKARAANLTGFELKQGVLSVATKTPTHPKTQELLQELQSRRYSLAVYMCSTASLEHAWERYKDLVDSEASKRGIFEINPEDIERLIGKITKVEDVKAIQKEVSTINNTRRITETMEMIFAGALALGASDIHIEPEENGIRLRYRFDGVLHDVTDLDSYIYQRLMSRLKLLAGMILNARNEAQDGRFTFTFSEREIEIRASVIPGAFGESMVMRLLDPTAASFTMDRIDLNPYIEAVMRQQLKRPNGLIITTGPTGSGKTTALYAYLQEVHNEGIKIITIENPVEYKLDGIVHTQTGDDYTFASGLRAILRQDPDVIMVGEIRDHEVAETAIHAAQTGHLVFSTLHTNSAVAGFPRLIDLGVDPRIMGSSINIIMGQRLIRKLCTECKVAYEATPAERQLIEHVMATHPHPIAIPTPLTLYRPSGCAACGNTGFKGRMGIFEGIVMDEAVEEAVIRDPREHVILDAARPQGIPTMVEDGIEKVINGLTSLKELERMIELPYDIASAIKTTSEVTPLPSSEISDDDFLKHIV
ncbi:MAG: type II/IV secretion system protein [Candidatus Kaiserbacteria bacterium]|nr:type II/IV secretion system protein [Candidatus Kaiserbacteria bacterium]MCB9816487.1 type II/IV secretion system protein [Candidatus Nomurabacteria bacterium]